jgi:hypothetical protein
MKMKGNLSWLDGLKFWLIGLVALFAVKTVLDKHVDNVTDKVNGIITDEIIAATPLQIIESCASKYLSDDGGKTTGVARHKRLVVAHVTDSHADEIRMSRFVDFVNTHDIIDFAIHSGDVDTPELWAQMVDSCLKPLYLSIGNHDGDAYDSSATAFTGYLYDQYIAKMVRKQQMSVSTNYYYVDNETYEAKIRFIFLNEYDYPDGICREQVPGGFYNGIFSQGQIDWLVATLQDCAENGYYAVICSHQKPVKVQKNERPFYQAYDVKVTPNNNYKGDILGDLIHAYKNGKAIKKDYAPNNKMPDDLPTIHVDTRFSQNGEFIAFINGHNHGDYIGYSTHYPDQLILNGPLSRGGKFLVQEEQRLYSDLPRSEDDDTQDCYNVYVFDMEHRSVHVIRIGSHMTNQMKLRKYAAYSF